MKLKLTQLLLAICSLSATAQIQFTLEEDYFAGPVLNKDKNYTGGFFLSIPHAQSRERKDFAIKHALKWVAPERLESIQDEPPRFKLAA